MVDGDASGMVMPRHGAGLQTGLTTGDLAAEGAVNYFENQTPLSSYEASWKEQIGLEMENSKLMRQASDRVMAHRFLFDLMLRMMGTKRIADVIMCQIPGGMGTIMRRLGLARTATS